jgi:hypothetical protein
MEDFWPITVASALRKIFECILCKLIANHTQHICNTNNQLGFLKGYSTMGAIIQVGEHFSYAKDKRNVNNHHLF